MAMSSKHQDDYKNEGERDTEASFIKIEPIEVLFEENIDFDVRRIKKE